MLRFAIGGLAAGMILVAAGAYAQHSQPPAPDKTQPTTDHGGMTSGDKGQSGMGMGQGHMMEMHKMMHPGGNAAPPANGTQPAPTTNAPPAQTGQLPSPPAQCPPGTTMQMDSSGQHTCK